MDDQTNQTPGAVVPPVDPAGQVPAADPGVGVPPAPVGGDVPAGAPAPTWTPPASDPAAPVVPPVDPAGQVPAADPGVGAPVGGGTWDPNQGGNSGTPTGTV